MGVDLGDPVLIRTRSWRWFTVRVNGLLNRPAVPDAAGRLLYATRVQQAAFGPIAAEAPPPTDYAEEG